MNPNGLTKMLIRICNTYNYPMPRSLSLNPRLKSTLGLCFVEAGNIELNEYVVYHNSKKVVEAILKHEVCHLRHCNHNKEFDVAVRLMGSSTHIEDLFPNVKLPHTYEYRCPVCNNSFYRDKKIRTSCGVCNPYIYDERFKLKLVKS